jgi:hypothetical protein
MGPDLLYERVRLDGMSVRIRVTTPADAVPIQAVLEVERRSAAGRAISRGRPPRLAEVTATNREEILSSLLPIADDDMAIEELRTSRGV